MGDPAYKALPRRTVRYWCYRFKTETGSKGEAPGATASGAPRGLRKYFESHKHFTGWELFGESRGWDVDDDDHFAIVPLREGCTDAWNRELNILATDFPG